VDERAFDRMARLWGTTTDRRRALQLIGASVIAGSWLRSSKSAAAQMTCTQDADCQDGDADPCTGGRCEGGTCTFTSVFCAPGFACCGNGECCPEESPGSVACASDADCQDADADPCTGARCEGGTCVSSILTCAAGFTCCAGACVADCPDGQGVDANCQCPGGSASSGGDPTTPSEPTGAGSAEDNAVQPTRLPNTGVHPTTPTGGRPLPPLLAAAAAGMAMCWRVTRERMVRSSRPR
jgi:hypothetical protein